MKRYMTPFIGFLLIGMLFCVASANAEYIHGTVSGEVTFYVESTGSGSSYITLVSDMGVAKVEQHNMIGVYTGTGYEDTHGFYRVKYSHNGTTRTVVWAPSATCNTGSVSTCEELQLRFPDTGTYRITVQPLFNSEAADYWIMDRIASWVQGASWYVNHVNGCSVTVTEPSRAAQLQVYYLDRNNVTLCSMEYISVTGSRWIYAKDISGYSCSNGAVYVNYDGYGSCTPEYICFYYDKIATAAPRTVTPPPYAPPVRSGKVYPSGWAHGSFAHGCSELSCLFDGNYGSSFYWNISRADYHAARGRNEPPITVYFDNATVGSIGLVQGGFARGAVLYIPHFRITCGNGTVGDEYIPFDIYGMGLQKRSFSRTYTDVIRIEMYLDDGQNTFISDGSYDCYLMEMEFYAGR